MNERLQMKIQLIKNLSNINQSYLQYDRKKKLNNFLCNLVKEMSIKLCKKMNNQMDQKKDMSKKEVDENNLLIKQI